jgi:AbrB family looped-hinge helix DNA binding protein
MMVSKLTSKGQVTIPKKIREFLKVDVSDRITFTPIEDGKVLITSERKSATVMFGMLKHRMPATPVSPEEMDAAIQKKRLERNG